ncbi:flagellar basal body-associated protein FliL [Stutzerimonas zhaodongensis]|uniref:Flagellar protein FliL n=1 Tax=Stutzerimonas zhaodongensis TaxID=1176257 RepID=A0A3M2HRH7_9GAMM|nr:flagellar basal body-associated protein FliL [Stutzerimonas zhaodongensis]MCQ2031115.1 flagellar basal body-associated protein FliL [Stutzerimonas zhaodongensis]MCQ4314837.1 flagellar basal body-associated protein FliL [Stutzerimonas zhaodongensis]RMH92336.1 flagellar basal body-associated protein FliL [Stutzerimonas zhaodongensis]
MAKKQGPPDVASPGAEGGGKGKLKLIIFIVIGLLLAIGLSVGGTFYFMSRGGEKPAADEAAATPAAPQRQAAIYEVLAPAFIVNFANAGGRQRYMQVSVALMSRDQAALDGLKEHMPLLRNQLVMLFSSQEFASLATPVGQEMLRQQATASVQELAQKELGKLAIEQVLFTNFVLQ